MLNHIFLLVLKHWKNCPKLFIFNITFLEYYLNGIKFLSQIQTVNKLIYLCNQQRKPLIFQYHISIFTLTEFIKVSSNKMKTIIINYGLDIVFWYITADSDNKFRETIM